MLPTRRLSLEEWNVEFHITRIWTKRKHSKKAENYSSSSTNHGRRDCFYAVCVCVCVLQRVALPPKRPESRRNSAFPDRGRMPLSLAAARAQFSACWECPRDCSRATRPRRNKARGNNRPDNRPALHSNQVGRLSERCGEQTDRLCFSVPTHNQLN